MVMFLMLIVVMVTRVVTIMDTVFLVGIARGVGCRVVIAASEGKAKIKGKEMDNVWLRRCFERAAVEAVVPVAFRYFRNRNGKITIHAEVIATVRSGREWR